jgi:molecular chaperone DnaK
MTAQDGQEYVRVQIFEGGHAMTRGNQLLGAFDLTELPPRPRGTAEIHVTFQFDEDKTLRVTAEHKSSNNR